MKQNEMTNPRSHASFSPFFSFSLFFVYSNAPLSFSSKVCYIKYRDPSSVGVAQHLTNTVFIDRALIVVPCAEGECRPLRLKKQPWLCYDLLPLNSVVVVEFWVIFM